MALSGVSVSSFASDFNFLSNLFSLLSKSEVDGLRAKYTMELIKIQKVPMKHFPSCKHYNYFELFHNVAKEEDSKMHLTKIIPYFEGHFVLLFIFREEVIEAFSDLY